MDFISKISIIELSKIINAKIIGDTKLYIKGLNEIHKVEEGDIVFVDNKKYYDKALNSKASAISPVRSTAMLLDTGASEEPNADITSM